MICVQYAMELERRRETLLTQADAYFDILESTVRSRQTYLGNGLMFLEGLFQEMSSIRKASPVEFLLKAPSIASRMESAVVEAKLAIGPIDDLVRADGPMPSFAPPSSAAIAAGLATIKVLDGTVPPSPTPVTAALPPSHAPLAAPPAVTTLAAIEAPSPLPASPARPVHTVSPPQQASPQAPPPANGAAVQAAKPPPGHISAMLPPPRPNGAVAPPPPRAPSPPAPVETQQAAPPAVINRAGGGAVKRGSRPDFMDSADFPPLEPAKKGESPTDWLAVKAQEKKKEKEKKQQEKKAAAAAGAKAAPQPQQQNGEKEQHMAAKPAAGGGGGGKGGKFHKEKAKAAPVEPFDASKPHVCVMNNITNGGMDGFLHLHPPDGSYFAIYYNFIGKVATINRDGR